MNYKNAKDVIPYELLSELQKYVDGDLLYIPKKSGRSPWGEKNGTRNEFLQRNRRIVYDYKHGVTMDELSGKYCLSSETLRKIIFKN